MTLRDRLDALHAAVQPVEGIVVNLPERDMRPQGGPIVQ